MKRLFSHNALFFAVFVMLLLSCEALPFSYSKSQSWYIPENPGGQGLGNGQTARPTLRLTDVSVDRTGGWESTGKEFAALAPLCFWKQGWAVVFGPPSGADYAAEIQVREREYSSGWRTRRSLAVEVRIWASGDEPGNGREQKLPLAAGRVVAIGEGSFSSSDTAERMLSRAIKQAVKKMPKKAH
jgi:hypothetical protein